MSNPLARKLEKFGPLSDRDRALLRDVIQDPREVPRRTDLVQEGDAPDKVQLIVDGFACRYKITDEGKRQITAYLVPGDFCNLHIFILRAMDHSIATLSPCRVVGIHRHRVLEMMERPSLARALWWATLVDEATLREWLVGLGSRETAQRIGHLLCELLCRLRSVGLAEQDSFKFPLTQEELGDTVGVTTVHVNRSLKVLREKGFIAFKGTSLSILDAPGLRDFSGFTSNYLHLEEHGGRREPLHVVTSVSAADASIAEALERKRS